MFLRRLDASAFGEHELAQLRRPAVGVAVPPQAPELITSHAAGTGQQHLAGPASALVGCSFEYSDGPPSAPRVVQTFPFEQA